MLYSASTGGFYSREIHGDNMPADVVEITAEEHAALLAGQSAGRVIAADAEGRPVLQDQPPPTSEQIIASFVSAVQRRLDDFAKTRGYDGILSAATYATSTVPKFAGEGQYAVEARDATWAACYQMLDEVQSGHRPMLSIEEVMAELPELKWPAA